MTYAEMMDHLKELSSERTLKSKYDMNMNINLGEGCAGKVMLAANKVK